MIPSRVWLAAFAFVVLVPAAALRAQPSAAPPESPAGPIRELAPGVVRTIPPDQKVDESFSRHDVVELLKVDPKFDWAKDARFDHPIWSLEFSFKPLRFIEVDVPDPAGRFERKLIWYLVYNVKNKGQEPVRFFPWFRLESDDLGKRKAYPDRLVPVAVPLIQRREDPNRKLLNTVEIAGEIPPSPEGVDNSVWGVATWEDVDPRIDNFSIYVLGLTNAYRWKDDPKRGRTFTDKTLELNFWRPSDEFDEHEAEIRYGSKSGVDHRWIYR
ncbi:MAG: hypothetical protein K2Y37_05805 [Pirellulales bacterium]|nr:hypothetical protein [Pirellulales bacterium]